MTRKALFVGMYPNSVKVYLRTFYKNLVESIADMGYECYVIAPVSVTEYNNKLNQIPKYEKEKTKRGKIVHVFHPRYISYSNRLGPVKTGILTEASFTKAAYSVAKGLSKENSFEFVYGHFFVSGGLSAIKIGSNLNIPAFVAFGESEYKKQVVDNFRELTEKDIQGLSGIISVSSKNTKLLEDMEIFRDIPVITAPNGVNLSNFKTLDKDQCRRRLNLPSDDFIVGFVGGFIERKGPLRVLEAINQIKDVYGAFAGKGEQQPVGDKVVFCRSLEHDDIPFFLNAIDVFCLPTLNEGSCNAIVEAGACGIPIISSDREFNDDLLNNENSIRINPMSIEEIRDAIILLKNEKKTAEMLGTSIQKTAQKFGIQERANTIIQFIDKCRNGWIYS